MALVFSPLSEDTLLEQPRSLFPKHAFVMRQLGEPPPADITMARIVGEVFAERGYGTKDADASTGSKDFLGRILGLIRGTAFTVAIFSEETRPDRHGQYRLGARLRGYVRQAAGHREVRGG